MTMAPVSPNMAVTVDIDYWSLKPQIRDIQWSNLRHGWIAHLFEDKTGLVGAMEVCIDCVTVHVYQYCNGTGMHQFEPCDTRGPVSHPSHIDKHYDLEPNNKYVRLAIERTPRPRWVPTAPHGINKLRGYNQKVIIHRRHTRECFRGSSPEYIIQGSGGISTSIYYRRCDGKFRNLAHQVLKMDTGDESPAQVAAETMKRNHHEVGKSNQAMDLVRQSMAAATETLKDAQRKDTSTRSIQGEVACVDLLSESPSREVQEEEAALRGTS